MQAVKSVEELPSLTKDYNIELTAEQAMEVFDKLRTGALRDDDLEGGMLYTPYNLRKRFRLTHKKI